MKDSDEELLVRCRRGDEAAWSLVVSRHTRRVFAIGYKFLGRVDEAEDMTQEVFVKVYQNLDRYQANSGAFSTWLGTIARNHAIDHYRRRREERLRREDDAEPRLQAAAAPEESPLGRLEREERAAIVRQGLRALPQTLREPVVLCDLRGLPYEDIAETLGLPLGTVKSRINRGRLELAKRLARRLESPE